MRELLCKEARKWMKLNHGKNVFAPFTGQDDAAFDVFVHALRLYGNSDVDGRTFALGCMRNAVLAMQSKTRWIAREAIAFHFDWADRETLWSKFKGPQLSFLPIARDVIVRRQDAGGAA